MNDSAIDEFRRQHAIQMQPDEVEYIVSTIRKAPANALVIEWGSGASTVRWLEEMRDTQRLISIEHNRKWYAIVQQVAEASPQLSKRFQYYLCEPNAHWDHGYGHLQEENPVGLDEYFCPDTAIFDADVFLIDGVARGVCAINVLYRSRRPDPIILLHDWYRRQPWYSWALQQFPIVERVGTTLVRLGKGSARSEDPDRYRKDALLLENALETEKDSFLRSRYPFHLARRYENAGEQEKALQSFLKRAKLGHWSDEVFMSLYSAGHLQEALGYPLEEVIATLMRASQAVPRRAEALHAASRICRTHNRFSEGYEYAKRGLAIPLPASGHWVVHWIYDYGLLDELAVNAYWSARYQESLDACERLLREGKMPLEMRDRVTKNADFARQKLSSPGQTAFEVPSG